MVHFREVSGFEVYANSTSSRNQGYWSYLSEHWLLTWLLTCVQDIINRNEQLEGKYRSLVSVPIVPRRPEDATLPSHLECLGRLTPYARRRSYRNNRESLELAHNTQAFLFFRDSSQLQFSVSMTFWCSFTSSCLLPCHHMAFAAEFHGQSLVPLAECSRWLFPLNDIQPAAENSESIQAVPKGKSSKLSVARNISSDVCEAIVRLNLSDFDACCRCLQTFADQVCADCVPSCVLFAEGVTGASRVEMLAAASTSLAATGDGISSPTVEVPVSFKDQPSTSTATTRRCIQKSLFPFYEDKMAGLDETFDLQCIKVLDHRVRNAAKHSIVAMYRTTEPMATHRDAAGRVVCTSSESACERCMIDWVQCDHCHL
ncbi:hypothetical protein CSKR_104418 [Clonorchis sinensis]|uniref:Uncharacterized protein n=1 Tax=Clonorchis sinensis TaxID=79923 RepID=A0A419PLH2_CLOSI|nr:hypothetical protein CSKR_104418 [Clonorchis sinensis]